MKYLILNLILILLLVGCYSEKKAQKDFGRVAATYPQIPADYCARTYPVIANTDSTAYLASKRLIDSLAKTIQEDSVLSQYEREALLIEVQRIRNSIPEPENCDSLYDALYLLIAQQTKRADRLEASNTKLLFAANNLKPVHDTVINKAELDKCNIERRKVQDELFATIQEMKKEIQNKKVWRKWALWTWFSLLLCFTGGYLLKKYKVI